MNSPHTASISSETADQRRILEGCLLGTAVGDALGLPAEGLGPNAVARRFGGPDRFHLIGRTGFVSDDTEQSAMVAEAITLHPNNSMACADHFRRELGRWFLRLPFGIGRATITASVRSLLGVRPSGVRSAGNGAAMRAAIVGAAFRDDPVRRREFGAVLAEVSHIHPLAVDGARYVAEVAAGLCSGGRRPEAAVSDALAQCSEPILQQAVAEAIQAVELQPTEAARKLGNSGYVVHTCAFATYALLHAHDLEPVSRLWNAIRAGGDADSIGAILGGWIGAAEGPNAFPTELVGHLHDGPYGPTHLRGLAAALAEAVSGRQTAPPEYSRGAAMARNLALCPVVLAHGFRRLAPPYG